MTKNAYTLATYHVTPGKEEAFIAAWDDLATTFTQLSHPPLWGTLIRSKTDPTLFHSFGPWESAEHLAAMRDNANARAAFAVLARLCEKMTPGDYELVTHVQVREDQPTQNFVSCTRLN